MKHIKGIVLAGGHGSRLYPLTFATSKQLLPVYDKPMIYYPISVLMHANIKNILIISTKSDLPRFKNLLGDGKHYGINFQYKIQHEPRGIAESLILAKEFIGTDDFCLILGDNIFYGDTFKGKLEIGINNLKKGYATIFGTEVSNPEEFGVISFDSHGNIKSIQEKPLKPKSNLIVSGLYFYKNSAIEYAENLIPSNRGELEITDINKIFLKNNNLMVERLGKDIFWSDTGTYNSLLYASNFFKNLEKETKKKAACIEHIALSMGFINKDKYIKIADSMSKSDYGKYLKKHFNELR